MLQLFVSDLSIARVSKILARYNVKASISNDVLQIDGSLSDELFAVLCSCITISKVQNFASEYSDETAECEAMTETQSESDFQVSNLTEEVPAEIPEATADMLQESLETAPYDDTAYFEPDGTLLKAPNPLYNTVKRGEVYLCDFGFPLGCEQGGKRPAIIVQNDIGNHYSSTTIVVPCTTALKHYQPTHISTEQADTKFYYSNLQENNTVLAEQITTIDKSRLLQFFGEMSDEFMDKLQDSIDISLGLRRKETVKEVPIRVEVPVRKDVIVEVPAPAEPRDINQNQLQLLTIVNVKELYEVSKMSGSNEEKAKTILKLFGFDLNQKGVKYLLKAMLISLATPNFTLESLCKTVSLQEKEDEADEVMRLIVARYKETLQLKGSRILDFIRLTTTFIK